jgi:TonB family protein
MAARNKPYDQFGPYILFKKLESDSIGELWRAGRIDGTQLGPTVALRRFTSGNRETLAASTTTASSFLPKLHGASFVREQNAGVEAGTPFLAWDYAGGRSLRYIIDRGRGGKDAQANPLPIDQAIVIAEKVALSLATIGEMRDTAGSRLSHGAMLPHFIWISDDGEIRVGGQLLGNGLMASLGDPNVATELGRYFSPEQRAGQKTNDVYSMGAILFLLVTGQEPPDAATASAFVAAVRAAKTPHGGPIPDDIRVILDKSFNLDPSMRYASMADMKQAISALAHGGKYSATTFNLAFYLSNLLKKEMDAEGAERERESNLVIAPYLEAPKPAPAPAAAAPLPQNAAPAMFAAAETPKAKSKLPLAVAAVVVLALAGGGAWMFLNKTPAAKPAAQTTSAAAITPPPQPRVITEPIAVTPTPTAVTATTTTGTVDPAAQQKAFEEAVRLKMDAERQKMNTEMMKLQEAYMAELRRTQAASAPAPAPPTQVSAAPEESGTRLTAAQLDQQRREAARQEQVAETASATQPAPVQQQPAPAVAVPQPAAPAPAPVQRPAVREGDVIDVSALDVVPRPTRPLSLNYPPLARQQKVSATVIVSAFIDEEGRVTEVKVLRGETRYGINDAAIRAMRSARFTSPMKDGKRVKTWLPQTFDFKP